jgi:hypothetical protein
VVLDSELRIQRINPAFCLMFRVAKTDVEGRLLYELAGGQWNLSELRKLLEGIVPGGGHFENFEVEQDFPGIGKKRLRLSGRRISGSDRRPAQTLLAIDEVE